MAVIERGVAPQTLGQAHTFPSATLRCNMLIVCTLVTTVNNRNKKKKLYKDFQSQKKKDSEFIALHIILVRPLFVQFCAILYLYNAGHLWFSASLFVIPHSLCTVGLMVTIEIAKGFCVTMVEVCTDTFVLFYFFLFSFLSSCKQAHIARS